MAGEMFEMRPDNGRTLPDDMLHHGRLIVRQRFALDDINRSLRTDAHAGTETVAEEIADKPRFSVDDLECPLGAVRDAFPAPRAFFFIDTDDLPFHGFAPGYLVILTEIAQSGERVIAFIPVVQVWSGTLFKRLHFLLLRLPAIGLEIGKQPNLQDLLPEDLPGSLARFPGSEPGRSGPSG